jgi:hypothetical protein
MAGNTNENDTEFSNIRILPENYEAILRGYLVEMKPFFTVEEKRLIHASGLLIIYMQALRFLTDYLNGDIYYQTDYPEHNLNRSKNQFALLQQLENFVEKKYSFTL